MLILLTQSNKAKILIFLVFCFATITLYQMLLLNAGRITVGSDAQSYYLEGIKPFFSPLEIKTNIGYPILNRVAFSGVPQKYHQYRMLLLKIMNSIIYCISMSVITNAVTEKERKRSVILALAAPFSLYFLTKNFREAWIFLGVALFWFDRRQSRKMLGFFLLLFFRANFAIYSVIAILYAKIYLTCSQKLKFGRSLFSLITFGALILLIWLYYIYSSDNAIRHLVSAAMAQSQGDAERLGNAGRMAKYVYSLGFTDLVFLLPKWFIEGVYRILIGLTPIDTFKIAAIINNKEFPLLLNSIDYLVIIAGSLYNTLFIIPMIFVFGTHVLRHIGYKKRVLFSDSIHAVSFMLFVLFVLMQYALGQGGGSDLRTRQVIISLTLIGVSELNHVYLLKSQMRPYAREYKLFTSLFLLVSVVLGMT